MLYPPTYHRWQSFRFLGPIASQFASFHAQNLSGRPPSQRGSQVSTEPGLTHINPRAICDGGIMVWASHAASLEGNPSLCWVPFLWDDAITHD